MQTAEDKDTPWVIWLLTAAGALCLTLAFTGTCASLSLRLILGFLAILIWLVLGAAIWLGRIAIHPDLGPAGREQNKNAIVVAAAFLGVIMIGMLVVCLATTITFKGATSAALLWAIGCLFAGGCVGFLFSLPKIIEESPVVTTFVPPPGTGTVPNPPAGVGPPAAGRGYQVNTSLNQLSDKLTAVLLGATLASISPIYEHFLKAVRHLGRGLSGTAESAQTAQAFASGLILAFTLLGFLGTYLLTRLWISMALVQADNGNSGAFVGTGISERDLAILENETRSFQETDRSLAGAALNVAERIAKVPFERLRTWREFAAWGKSNSELGKHKEAQRAFAQAVELYPESAELRLEYAVALFLHKTAADKEAAK